MNPSMTRRSFLGVGGLALGLPSLVSAEARTKEDPMSQIRPFGRYAELLETLKGRGHKLRILGHAPDKSPVVSVKTGGDKQPPIFMSAGAHATEQAGVAAAVELVDRLETRHAVHVVPTRDPIGLNGYRYALSLALGEEPSIDSVEDAEALLREKGDVLYDRDGVLLAFIGEYGYANRSLFRRFEKGEGFLEPLLGRRLFFPSRSEDEPGAGPLERAYTQVVTPDGEVLHLNRFHDTPWAPVEVRCARELMGEIRPGLSFDLHEYGGDAYWMSARRQRTEDDEQWEERLGRAAVRAVAESGARLPEDDYTPGSFFTRLENGLYTLDPSVRGEGLNLVDYAAHHFGPGFTIETGMRQEFAHRVRLQMIAVQTAVTLFEQRYA